MPRKQPSKATIKTSDVEAPKATTVELASTVDVVERPDLVVAQDVSMASPEMIEYAKDLKFMEDMLVITIGETTDPNAEDPVPSGCNGTVLWLKRGIEHKIARKFVDSLIKREDKIKTENYKDADNVDQTRVKRIPALKYALSIISDPAGDAGRRWFQHQAKNAY